MNKFEAVVLFSPDLNVTTLNKQEDILKKSLSNLSGSIIATEDWGLRDLSYAIHSNKKAFYKFYQIEINGSKIQEIKKILAQNEKILRHLFIKVEEHEELPTKLLKTDNN